MHAVAVEDVVAEDQRRRRSGDEIRADDIGLGEPLRARLLCIGQGQAPARSVAEQMAEPRQVLRRRNDQDFADPREHERGQRVVDHRLVVDRDQLLAGHERHRMKAGAAAAGQDDALHAIVLMSSLRVRAGDPCRFRAPPATPRARRRARLRCGIHRGTTGPAVAPRSDIRRW